MTVSDRRNRMRVYIVFLAVAGAVLVFDQATKAWVLRSLTAADPSAQTSTLEPRPVVHVIPGCLLLAYAENTGAAFSLFRDHPGLLTVLAIVLAGGVGIWAFLLPEEERLNRVALGMIFGGAVGNLIDRFQHGFVVDFIVAYIGSHAWPTFNVADSAICVGIGLILLASWFIHPPKPKGEPKSPSTKNAKA